MKNRSLIALSLALFAVGVASALARGYQVISTPAAVLSGPSEWVAFHADFRITDLSGNITTYGRLYRANNGSERRESHAPGVEGSHIAIFNIPKKMAYFLRPSGWESHPLELPRAGYKPSQQLSLGSRTLQSQTANTVERFQVWESAGGENQKMQLAPSLNFQPLVINREASVYALANITVGESAAALFEPPPDVHINATFRTLRMGRFTKDELGPAGIVPFGNPQ